MSFSTPWKAPLKTPASGNASQEVSQPVVKNPTMATVVKQMNFNKTDKENITVKIAEPKKSRPKKEFVGEIGAVRDNKAVPKPKAVTKPKKSDGKMSVVKEKSDSMAEKACVALPGKDTGEVHTGDIDLFANEACDEDLLNNSESDVNDHDFVESSVVDEQDEPLAKSKKAAAQRRRKPPMKVTLMTELDYDNLFGNVLQANAGSVQEGELEMKDEQNNDSTGSLPHKGNKVQIPTPLLTAPQPDQTSTTPKPPPGDASSPTTAAGTTESASTPNPSLTTPATPAGPNESATTPGQSPQEAEASASSGQDVTPLNTFLAPKELQRISNAPKQRPRSSLLGSGPIPRRIDFERLANEMTPSRPRAVLPFAALVTHKSSSGKGEKLLAGENAQRKIVFAHESSDGSAEKKTNKRKRRLSVAERESDGDNITETGTPVTSQRKETFNQSRDADSQGSKRVQPSFLSHSQALSSQHILSQTLSQVSVTPLSQPSKTLKPRERLEWYQKRRNVGIWVRCDKKGCNKWRYLPNSKDPLTFPAKWFCSMHPDKTLNSCQAPEVGPTLAEEEDLIHNLYTAGSLVWARMDGYPWWPAMVDDCPDTEQYYWLNGFSDIPTYYNVVFFDAAEVSRAWLAPKALQAFTGNKLSKELKQVSAAGVNYGKRIAYAQKQAQDALPMPIAERLRIFSFLARFKGIIDGKSIKNELKFRAKGILKAKRSKHTDIYSSDSSDESDSNDKRKQSLKRKKPVRLSKAILAKWIASKNKTNLKNKKSAKSAEGSTSHSEEDDSADENSYDDSGDEFVASGKKRAVETISPLASPNEEKPTKKKNTVETVSTSDSSDKEDSNADENKAGMDEDNKDNNDEEPPGEAARAGNETKDGNEKSDVASGVRSDEGQPSTFEKTANNLQQSEGQSGIVEEPEDLFPDEDFDLDEFTSIQATVGSILTSLVTDSDLTTSLPATEGATAPSHTQQGLLQISADAVNSVPQMSANAPNSLQKQILADAANSLHWNYECQVPVAQLTPDAASSQLESKELLKSESQDSDFLMPTQTQKAVKEPAKRASDNNVDGTLGAFQISMYADVDLTDVRFQNRDANYEQRQDLSKTGVGLTDVRFQNRDTNYEQEQDQSGNQWANSGIAATIEDVLEPDLSQTSNGIGVEAIKNTDSSESFLMPTQSLIFLNEACTTADTVGSLEPDETNNKEETASTSVNVSNFPDVQSTANNSDIDPNTYSCTLMTRELAASVESENALVPNLDDIQTIHVDNASDYDAVVPQMNANALLNDSMNTSGVGSPFSEDFEF